MEALLGRAVSVGSGAGMVTPAGSASLGTAASGWAPAAGRPLKPSGGRTPCVRGAGGGREAGGEGRRLGAAT